MFTSYRCRPSGGEKIAVVGIKPRIIRQNAGLGMQERMFIRWCDVGKYNDRCEDKNKGNT